MQLPVDVQDFEVSGCRYRLTAMPAQVETRILRRFAPVFADVLPLVLSAGPRLQIRSNIDVPKVMQRVMSAWGKLSDYDTDFIERASVGALSRLDGDEWLPVWPKDAAVPAFSDINGSILEQLMGWSLGLTVKGWLASDPDNVPAQVRAAIKHFH